jgi:acyl-coenzyme A synthetase/AMP-(fatty) acid ligase
MMYHEVVCQLDEGRVEYIDRSGSQMKHNGHRIEVAVVERALREHAKVADAVVALRRNNQVLHLVGYIVVTNPAKPPSVSLLRAHVAARLPHYMVPDMFTTVNRLPLTVDGEIHRDALTLTSTSKLLTDTPHQPPSAGLERTSAELWRELLGLDQDRH